MAELARHLPFRIGAADCEPLVTHVFVAGDVYLDSDLAFGVKDSLIREFTRQPAGRAAAGQRVERPCFHLHYDFALKSRTAAIDERMAAAGAGA